MRHLRPAASACISVVFFLALVTAQETGLDTCTDVHVFLARGNNEPYPGRQSKLVQAICSDLVGLASCDYEDVAFNNALEVEYCSAVEAGRKAGVAQITAYNKRCPDTKLVVSGYSQGGHVLGDILGGGGGVFFQSCTTPTAAGLDPDSAPGNKISAALLFGDVRHTANQPYNTLAGSSINGLYPRTGQLLAGINKWAGLLRDWCQEDDPICAQGDGQRTYNVQHHLNYFDFYSGAAGLWVMSKLGVTAALTSSATEAPSTASTSASTSTSTAVTTSSSANATSTLTSATSSAFTSGSTSVSGTSTLLPEATDSGTTSAPTATPTQEGGTGIVRCFRGHIFLAALASFISMIT
ncbi:carbohydrate esterase family 5 protein [Hypoxylon fuscum]|nr:carbohydrate esterase family 5 protein [Hypoxylon fuscum]